MNYVKNQVQLIETIFGRKLEGDDLTDLFQLVGDIYNDGLADKMEGEGPEVFNMEADIVTLEKFI
jgi:hypothetical protein